MPANHNRLLQFGQQVQKFYEHQFIPVLERTGLSIREIHVLLFLANNPGFDTARDVTALRGLSKSQVSQAVELLAAEGLVLRTPDPADRRVVHLSITPLGAPLARECRGIQERCRQRLLEGLTPQEQAQFHALMQIILDNGDRLAKEV